MITEIFHQSIFSLEVTLFIWAADEFVHLLSLGGIFRKYKQTIDPEIFSKYYGKLFCFT